MVPLLKSFKERIFNAARLWDSLLYNTSVHIANGGIHLVTQEGVKRILSSSTGEIFLDNLFETDYLFRNMQVRMVNSASYSVNIAPMPVFDFKEDADPLASLADVKTYVQLMSPQSYIGKPFEDTLLNWSDSEYDVASTLVDNLIDGSKQYIKRSLAFRSSGVIAKILNVETWVDAYTGEHTNRYTVSSIDNIIDGEEIRLASQDSANSYAAGIITILDADAKMVSIRSHRAASVGDNILITSRAGLGVMGMYEMFVGERIFNSKRISLTTPSKILAKPHQTFDEFVGQARTISNAGNRLVAYMSQERFDHLIFNQQDLKTIDTGYDVYYEYHGVIIVINNFLRHTDEGKHYFLLLDLDTLTLNYNTPLQLAKNSSGEVYFVERDNPVTLIKTLQLFANFSFQLTCTDFKKNTLVEFQY